MVLDIDRRCYLVQRWYPWLMLCETRTLRRGFLCGNLWIFVFHCLIHNWIVWIIYNSIYIMKGSEKLLHIWPLRKVIDLCCFALLEASKKLWTVSSDGSRCPSITIQQFQLKSLRSQSHSVRLIYTIKYSSQYLTGLLKNFQKSKNWMPCNGVSLGRQTSFL